MTWKFLRNLDLTTPMLKESKFQNTEEFIPQKYLQRGLSNERHSIDFRLLRLCLKMNM